MLHRKLLTHNVELPVRFHELSSDLWIFRTARDGLSVVLDCRNEAHLRPGCVDVDHFILWRIKGRKNGKIKNGLNSLEQ